MTDTTFGEVQFEQLEVDEDGRGKFSRVDLTPYKRFIEGLASKPAGTEARIQVITGEIIVKGKSAKGRGKKELSDARAFQAAASEAGKGLRVGWRHQPDGTTILRMMLQPKRTFSEDTQRKRNQALDTRRLAMARAKLHADPGNPELVEKVKTIEARLNGEVPARATGAKKTITAQGTRPQS